MVNVDLMQETTEIKSFNDVQKVESLITQNATEKKSIPLSESDYSPGMTKIKIDNLDCQINELTQAINILTIIEDHHFTELKSPAPCEEEAERIGTLITVALTKLIPIKRNLENMAGGPDTRLFNLTAPSPL